jgi:type III HopA1-like effector protein
VSRYHDQVTAALDAVTIRGPTRYAWLGRPSRGLPAQLEAQLDDALRAAYLASTLEHELYWSFYCRGAAVPARWGEPQPAAADPELSAALSEANAGSGSWEAGWTAERRDGHDAVVANGRLRVRVALANCRAPTGIRSGAAISVRKPKEHVWVAPGFYTALSDAPAESQAGVLRVYWHVTARGAAALVRALTARLNAVAVPFQLKVADHPARMNRCDAAVLYLPAVDLDALRPTLLEVASELEPHLRPSVPAFTLELASGVALAEHDGGAESFGTRRCRLLAEAIVHAHASGLSGVGEQLTVVAERFAQAGIRIDAPYREPLLAGRHVL